MKQILVAANDVEGYINNRKIEALLNKEAELESYKQSVENFLFLENLSEAFIFKHFWPVFQLDSKLPDDLAQNLRDTYTSM